MAQDHRFPNSLTRRRFLQYTGSMALGGSLLAACAGTGGGSGSTSSNGLPTINQWYHQYGEQGTEQAVYRYAKGYTKANVQVSWVPGTGNDYPNKVNAALLGSNPPDIFELPQATVAQVKAGLIEPLDDIIADVKSDFNPTVLKGATINGKIYSIKMINDFGVVYYRKSMLQQKGIQPPTTMDELIAAVKKFANDKVKGLYIGTDGGVNAVGYIVGWSSGGDFITSDNKIVFNTDRMAAAYEKLKELNATGGLLPDAPVFWWAPDPFIQGMCAMQYTGFWALPQIVKALGDDVGIFAWPKLDAQGTAAIGLGGWGEMVSAKSKNIEAAKAYVKYLWIDNQQIQTDWSTGYGFHVPPRLSIAAKADKLKTGIAAQAVALLNQYGKATTPYWDATMDSTLTDAISNILKHNANASAQLSQAADKCNTELQKLL
jgi:multiple sugar transport system substrate-binding protein